jgi:aminoglycoside phosphotransferase (APT) family kinase protein
VSAFSLSRVPAPDEAEELRESIELALERATGLSTRVAAIRRRGFRASTSYPVEILTVELASGEAFHVFLKDFGRSRLPKDAAAERRERELRVYEELLPGQELGTARLYGSSWEESAGRFWLMLELVDGQLLRDCNYEYYWPLAAAWLGRFHGRFAGQRDRLQASRFLVQHDAAFFVEAAERALRAVSGLSAALAERLAAALKGYDAMAAVLSRNAEVLVHGSYREQNVLVVRSSNPARICPIDWELAAFGSSTYDLAFLCDGFRGSQLDELLDAYEQEAESFGRSRRERDELRHEIDCFRLHKKVNSLGHLRQWHRPLETATHVVDRVETLAGALS